MSATPWVLAGLNAVVALMLGFLNLVARAKPGSIPAILRPLADWAGPNPTLRIWILTSLAVVIPLADRAVGAHSFRKRKVQGVLDQLEDELFSGDARTHRITLFKAVRGWRAWLSVFGNRWWRQDEKWLTLRDVVLLNPFGLYLYVYARPRRARNPHSCAVYRVFRGKERDCDGIAGLVWQRGDELTKLNLQHSFEPGDLRKVMDIDALADQDPIRTYARETNIRGIRQLRAREHYGRHFHGTVIEDGSGEPWGVLLLDSLSAECPIPDNAKNRKAFSERWNRYTDLLSHLLT